ncbi:MAG: hypothetical protein Q9226_003265 [Calogaya cf. arnoldii]
MADRQETHAAASLSTMPTEIISEVYSNLHKEDLKSVRLTCHRFDEISQPILFDKVIVTSMDDNAELFECVINKPHLARHVKTLVLDIPIFHDYKAAYYVQRLTQQMEDDVARHPKSLVPPGLLRKKLKEVKWFKDPGRTHLRERVLAVFMQDLRQYYATYTAMRHKQQQCIEEILPQCVAVAFTNCVNVQHVEVQTEWQAYDRPIDDTLMSLLPCFSSSGSVARHYNPLLLRPSLPTRDSPCQEQFLLQLLESASQITKLKVGKGFIGPRHGLEIVGRALFFQHLTNLDLWTSSANPPPFFVDYLASALQNARNLQRLHIGACNTSRFEHYDMNRLGIFPLLQDCIWPRLVTLRLTGVVASGEDFLTLFKSHKGLKSLTLTSIDLRLYLDPAIVDKELHSKVEETMTALSWNMRRLMSLTEISFETGFRVQIGEYTWVPVDIEDMVRWEKVVLGL